MLFLFGIVFLATKVSSASIDEDRARKALHNPDLFEGDILGIDPYDRISFERKAWTDNTIPYVIDDSLAENSDLIKEAMEDYQTKTCLKFKERTTENNYIKLFSGNGCYSNIGMSDIGQQPVSLGPGCMYKGTIIHELGHAIGFFHEQSRWDRDDYLIIYWDNILKGMEGQFHKQDPRYNVLYTPFDHKSIMIYGSYSFSKDRKSMTMVSKNGEILQEPYEKGVLTDSDAERVRKKYKC